MQLGNLIIRVPQIVLVIVVLGLSGSLVAGQQKGGSPAITNFTVATGALGLLASLIGLASAFVESLQGLVMLAVDALTTLFFLAASIAMAVKLGVHSCSDTDSYTSVNGIINGGALAADSDSPSGLGWYEPASYYTKRCREAQACDAFLFFGLIAFASALVFDGLALRHGAGKSRRGL